MNNVKWIVAAAAALALGVLTLPFLGGPSGSGPQAASTNASCSAEGPANLELTL
jgi:hypothetical protein